MFRRPAWWSAALLIPTATAQDITEVMVRDAAVIERHVGTRQVGVEVCLLPAQPTDTSIEFQTADGSAVAGDDYVAAAGTLAIPAGQTRGVILLTVIGDTLPEIDEVFHVNLIAQALPGAVVDGQAAVRILDDEIRPLLAGGSHPQLIEGHPAGSSGEWVVETLSSSPEPFEAIPASGEPSAATPGIDFTIGGPAFPWPGFNAPTRISLSVLNDSAEEAVETVSLHLSHPNPRTQMLVFGETFATPPIEAPTVGAAVGIDGDLMIVGTAGTWPAPGTIPPHSGPVSVWAREGAAWAPSAILSSADPGGFVSFGRWADLSGTTVAVLETGLSDPTLGSVYLFDKEGGGAGWRLSRRVPAPIHSDPIDRPIDLNGDWLAVGGGVANGETGKLVIRHRHEGGRDQWGIVQSIEAPAVGGGADFALTVGWAGTALIAIDKYDVNGAGQVRVFEPDGTTGRWALHRSFSPPKVNPSDAIGKLALSRDAFALANVRNPFTGQAGVGVFGRDGGGEGQWGLQGVAGPAFPGVPSNRFFGRSLSLQRHFLVVDNLLFTVPASDPIGPRPAAPLIPGGYETPLPMLNDFEPFAVSTASDDQTIVLTSGHGRARVFSQSTLAAEISDDDRKVLEIRPAEAAESTFANQVTGAGFTVAWADGIALPIDVDFTVRTVDGTASATDGDYEALAGVTYRLSAGEAEGGTWVAGGVAGGVFVRVFTDSLTETDETFYLVGENPTFGRFAAGPGGLGTIHETLPHIILRGNISTVEGTGPGSVAMVPVRLSKPSSLPVSATVIAVPAPVAFPATIGEDVPAVLGTMTFDPGQTQGQFAVPIVGDDWCEGIEVFRIEYVNQVGAGLPPPSTPTFTLSVAITDDDPLGPAPDAAAITQGGVWSGNVAANDCSLAEVTLKGMPKHGEVTRFTADGSVTYVPNPNFIGVETISYTRPTVDRSAGVIVVDAAAAWNVRHPLDGVDPAGSEPAFHATWTTNGYDDSAWAPGTGLMGYGAITGPAGDLVMTTPFSTPALGLRYTAYFRHQFSLPAAGRYYPEIRVVRDDSLIVYLNGVEFARNNVDPGKPDAYRLLSGAVIQPDEGVPVSLLGGLVEFPAGPNTVALSLHNGTADSSDLGLQIQSLTLFPSGQSSPVPVRVTVTDAKRAPILVDDTYAIETDGPLVIAAGPASPYGNDGLLGDAGAAFDPILEAGVIPGPGGRVDSFDPQTGGFRWEPEGDFTGSSSFSYRVRDKDGWSAPATISVHRIGPALTYEQWRDAIFPGGMVAEQLEPDANPDGDAFSNLAECAFGLDPVTAGTAPVTDCRVQGGRVTVTITIAAAGRPGLLYELQASPDLASGAWAVLSSSTGGIDWAGATPDRTTVLTPAQRQLEFEFGATADIFPKREAWHFRVRVSR